MGKRQVLIKGMNADIWKQARLAAVVKGETMASFVEQAITLRLSHEFQELRSLGRSSIGAGADEGNAEPAPNSNVEA